MANLASKIRDLPSRPGVYTFRNKDKNIIYIGKALSLKHRVGSYFQKTKKDPKTTRLVAEINAVEHQVVNSEFEALLLEAKLIKDYRPRYNIQGKDGHRYVYLAISQTPFPALFLTRQPEKEANLLDWYGPFPSTRDAQLILKTIRHIFPFCQSRKKLRRACFYHHLRLCPGICAFDVPDYPKTIQKIRQVLAGKTQSLLRELEKEIRTASQVLNYEKALVLKRQVELLSGNPASGWRQVPLAKKLWDKAAIEIRKILSRYQGNEPTTISKIEGYDVSNLGKQIIVGSMAVFVNGEPEKALYRRFRIRFQSEQDDPKAIGEVLGRRLKHPEWIYPQLILIDGGKTQLSAAFSALKNNALAKELSLLGLTKEEETLIIPQITQGLIGGWKAVKLARNSPALQLLQSIRDEAHRFAQSYYHQLQRKKLVG